LLKCVDVAWETTNSVVPALLIDRGVEVTAVDLETVVDDLDV
jgi:hypothetical protein